MGVLERKSVGIYQAFFTLGSEVHVIKRMLLGPVIQENMVGDENWGCVERQTKRQKLGS